MTTTAPNQAFAFGTPFEKQVEHLRNKLRLPTARWDDITASAHDRAFIVAGAAKADLLADLHQAVIKAASDGEGLQAFRKNFKSIVAKHGWTGWTGEDSKSGEAWRTRVIYQTNMATSYAAGRFQQMTDPEVLKLHPYWRYIHSDGVLHPRPQHLAWHGLTLLADHPFWKTHYCPNGWFCQCRITSVSRKEGEASARAGLGDPPDGWDKLDPKTGAQVGIDRGFDYTPGRSLATEMRTFVESKSTTLPKELATSLVGDLAKLPSKVAFVEAKTAKAAGEWAVKANLVDFADYAGVKPEVANAFNKSLYDHLQEFPALRSNQKFIGTSQAQFARWREFEIARYIDRLKVANPNAGPDYDFKKIAERYVKAKKVMGSYAHSWSQADVSGIAVNKKFGADVGMFERALKRDVEANWHPIGADTVRSVVDHELAHQLDGLLGLHLDTEVISTYKKALTKGIKDEVSGYAGKNIKEFIAECWAESCNNPQPREFARIIAGLLRKRYADKYPGVRAQ